MGKEKLYIDLDNEGYVQVCGTTPVNGSELYVELEEEDMEDVFIYSCCYKYVEGKLVLDQDKKEAINEEEQLEKIRPTEQERINALEEAILDLIRNGGQ